MIALREAHRAGLLSRPHWLPNVLAGVVVGVVALPLAMAFAIASGAQPQQGLYTAIVAGLCVSIFGGSRVQIAGPTGAFVVILSGITAKYGFEGLQIATFMAGAMLLLLGLAGFGTIIRYIPHPVIVGFTAGIAVIIWVGEWKDFFGLPPGVGAHFYDKTWSLARSLPQLHPATTALGVASLMVVTLAPRWKATVRVPAPLIALVLATSAQAWFQFDGVATLGSAFGGVPRGLPAFDVPRITFRDAVELIGPAFTIAILGAIESLLSAAVADGMAGTRHDSNQELIGQGIANLAAPMFGGFAATGAIARTATNIRNGGTSPVAGIVHAIILALVLLVLAPLAYDVPLAVLAAILFVVAWNMSEIPRVIKLVRGAPRADVVILGVTFGLTVLTDIVVAVNIGVILATFQFLRRMSSSVEVRAVTGPEPEPPIPPLPADVKVWSVDGPFFFGAVEHFERALAKTHSDPRVMIVLLNRVPFIDSTGLQTLEEAVRDLETRHVKVILAGGNARVEGKLRRAGLVDLVGAGNVVADLAAALEQASSTRPDL